MKNFKYVKILALAGIIVLTGRCMKDKINLQNVDMSGNLHPGIAMPLIKGSFSIKDWVKDDDTLFVEENDTLKLVIKQESLYTFDIANFELVRDQSQVQSISIPTLPVLNASNPLIDALLLDTTFAQEYLIPLNDSGTWLDYIEMEGGELEITVNSTLEHSATLTIWSNNVKDGNSNPFSQTILIDNSGSFSTTQTYSMDNHTLHFDRNPPANDSTRLPINFDISFTRQPGVGITTGHQDFSVSYVIRGLNNYKVIYGYAGQKGDTLNISEDAPLESFGNLVEGSSLKFTDPKLRFTYSTSFGVDMGTQFTIVPKFDSGDSAILKPSNKTTIIGLPLSQASDENSISSGVLRLNRNNISNIDSLFIFPPPSVFNIEVIALANPEGDTSVSNFMRKNSKMEFGLEMELPLEIYADLIYRDTIDFPLDVEQVEDVDFAEIHYEFTNEFPLEFEVEMIPFDTVNNKLFTESAIKFTSADTTKPFLRAAPVDANGKVILDQVETYTDYITISKEKYDVLKNDAHYKAILNVYLKTTENANSVDVLSSYKLNYRLGINVQATYSFGE